MRRPPFLFGFACLSLLFAACSGVDPFGDRPYVGSAHATAPHASLTLPAPAPTPAPGSISASPEDQRMFLLVNEIRASKGLHPFRWNERLYRAAIDHSAEQDRHGYMGHGSPDPKRDDLGDRVRLAGYSAHAWAEVVAWGYKGPEDVVQGWMDSRGHRHILLDPTLVDAGFSRVGDYFTGDFGTP